LYGGGNRGQAGIYHLTDGVSDREFEESVEEAKAEGNLSRANVQTHKRPLWPVSRGGRFRVANSEIHYITLISLPHRLA
jgi:hypothetical protein